MYKKTDIADNERNINYSVLESEMHNHLKKIFK